MRLFSHSNLLRVSLGGVFAFLSHVAGAGLSQRLSDGWEYHQGSLGSTWEIWRGEAASDNVTWTAVTLPHCFNARDAVDPDTLLHFSKPSTRKPSAV
ncbi:MAG: hypothetical protein RLZZ214_1028 [Verrucomicrobiota bacterium]|jgi:beta-galactosidase